MITKLKLTSVRLGGEKVQCFAVTVFHIFLSCGAQFTSRLEGMLNDLSTANDVQRDFRIKMKNEVKKSSKIGWILSRSFLHWVVHRIPSILTRFNCPVCSQPNLPVGSLLRDNFSVMVLTSGNWPTYQSTFLYLLHLLKNLEMLLCSIRFCSAPEVSLPADMQLCTKTFQDWYTNEKTSHRKLSWVHHLGSWAEKLICGRHMLSRRWLSLTCMDGLVNVNSSSTMLRPFGLYCGRDVCLFTLTGNVIITSRFPSGRVYDLQCNTFQACLLFLFNSEVVLSTSVIRDALGLDETLTKRLIA